MRNAYARLALSVFALRIKFLIRHLPGRRADTIDLGPKRQQQRSKPFCDIPLSRNAKLHGGDRPPRKDEPVLVVAFSSSPALKSQGFGLGLGLRQCQPLPRPGP